MSNRDDQASSRHSTVVRCFQMTEGLKDSLYDPKDPPPVDGSRKTCLFLHDQNPADVFV